MVQVVYLMRNIIGFLGGVGVCFIVHVYSTVRGELKIPERILAVIAISIALIISLALTNAK